MKTGLDYYLEKHLDQLDVELPDDDHIWAGISRNLERSANRKRWFLPIAAMVIILLSFGSAAILYMWKHGSLGPHFVSLTDLSQSLADEENLFRFVLQEKMKRLDASFVDPATLQRMLTEINDLDKQYAGYLEDLNTLGNQPRIIQGLKRCYELKIKILERTLFEIQKTERYENKKNVL